MEHYHSKTHTSHHLYSVFYGGFKTRIPTEWYCKTCNEFFHDSTNEPILMGHKPAAVSLDNPKNGK